MHCMMRPRHGLPAIVHCISTVVGVGSGLARLFPQFFHSRSALVAENLFLRKQLAFYQERKIAPRRLRDAARLCLVAWSRLFNWRETLVIVKPETLIGWHRKSRREAPLAPSPFSAVRNTAFPAFLWAGTHFGLPSKVTVSLGRIHIKSQLGSMQGSSGQSLVTPSAQIT